jgi:hypothetical protein
MSATTIDAADSNRRFPQRVTLRAPRGLLAAVELAAERHHSSPAEWMRQALLRALHQDGVSLRAGRAECVPPTAHHSTVLDGGR